MYFVWCPPVCLDIIINSENPSDSFVLNVNNVDSIISSNGNTKKAPYG